MTTTHAPASSEEAPLEERSSPLSTARFRIGFATDIGKRRTQNQDHFAVVPELGLFMVADGMGGHQGGETASQMATQLVAETLGRMERESAGWDPRPAISDAIRAANEAIYDRSLRTPSLSGMGTTATALIFKGDDLFIGHVGDSRCYLLRREEPSGELRLWQLTRDHSLVQEKLRAGIITRDEIRTDRMKNVITRSVGFERDINVETYHWRTGPGDIFLVCSDGLSGLVEDPVIRNLVQEGLIDPRRKSEADERDIDSTVHRLIDEANRNGGDDNITTIMLEVL